MVQVAASTQPNHRVQDHGWAARSAPSVRPWRAALVLLLLQRLGYVILKVFSNLNVSVILHYQPFPWWLAGILLYVHTHPTCLRLCFWL